MKIQYNTIQQNQKDIRDLKSRISIMEKNIKIALRKLKKREVAKESMIQEFDLLPKKEEPK